ncbi:hypothetical protein Poli38472_012153 [Pythium oligandrum]|uniref:FYVE-type domain-containing protein n=1 Tax=Pythium oligandrum TaxID=41045 RepID=A0A8K1FPL9_PYTOL|nr:hypothetical protein Poli38472_012153 [Pythium oligandrum]|eukprot:TMW67037.1 hypothetical protein Poli38472_012153 [Pythium oligandrum]
MPSTTLTGSDHPVFKRFSRQQLVVRRRNIGFQALIFEPIQSRASRCKHCGRQFNTVWKEYLCHVCGFWVCQPCSCVIEREREMQYIHFIRSCMDCLSMLNKWSDADLLAEFAMSPWVVTSSKKQISLNISDTLRTQKESRRAVLTILKQLGMAVDPMAPYIDAIPEDEWVAASTPGGPQGSDTRESSCGPDDTAAERVQYLVQQCFEVVIPELTLQECVFAESDGSRQYPIHFIDPEEPPHAPILTSETERQAAIDRYGLLTRSLNTPVMQLICDLIAREFEAKNAIISVVNADLQHTIACASTGTCNTHDRSQAFCAYALTSHLPYMVRDAALDTRFRNFEAVRGGQRLLFYFGYPILGENGKTIASLCVLDTKPRKNITTMQYSITKKFAGIISALWQELIVASTV